MYGLPYGKNADGLADILIDTDPAPRDIADLRRTLDYEGPPFLGHQREQ